jgi:hypothetical protein
MSLESLQSLALQLRKQLEAIGYKFFDEPDTGWAWEIGEFYSDKVKPTFDSEAETLGDTLRDFAAGHQDLAAAAGQVVTRWGQGDLAEAVRALDRTLRALAAPHRAEASLPAATPVAATQRLWLVHGSTKGEAWIDAAYADRDVAIAVAVDEARQWKSSFAVNLTTVAAELSEGRAALIGGEGSEIWISVEPVEMRRSAQAGEPGRTTAAG